MRHVVTIALLTLLAAPVGCLFDPTVDDAVPIRCVDDEDCPGEMSCDGGRCLGPDAIAGERCGDGLIARSGVEDCDDGDANSDLEPDACRTDCSAPRCGDGVRDRSEGCDGGNESDNDSCTSFCAPSTCGDGVVNVGVRGADSDEGRVGAIEERRRHEEAGGVGQQDRQWPHAVGRLTERAAGVGNLPLQFAPRDGRKRRGVTSAICHCSSPRVMVANVAALSADRKNRAPFQGKASQHDPRICSFVQPQGPLNRPKPALSSHQAQDRRQRAGRRRRWRDSGGREQLKRHRRCLGPQGRERLGPQAEVLEGG